MLYSTMYHTKSGWSFKFSNVMTLEGLYVILNQCKKKQKQNKNIKKNPTIIQFIEWSLLLHVLLTFVQWNPNISV